MSERELTGLDFDTLRRYVEIPESAQRLLSKTEREISFDLNLVRDDGSLIAADCYLVYANTVRGPAKGGIRFARDVTLAETRDLAERMVYKTALAGVPFGGGKSAIAMDPRSLTRFEKMAVMKEFVHMLGLELRSGSYIPAPDLGTTPYDMAVIYGETHVPESVTGKPPSVGGLPGRREATGWGVCYTAGRAAEQFLGSPLDGLSVAVQGFGNVGSWTCRFLAGRGARVVAASDISGGLLAEDGLDVAALVRHVQAGATLDSFGAADHISNGELLALDVDLLIPAAVENVLHKGNAADIQARLVVEAANGPTTPEADAILRERGLVAVPDILANSGGVIASYVEWRQAKSGSLTEAQETYGVIRSRIDVAFDEMCARIEQHAITPRTACQIVAVEELVRSLHDRVWI